ncbi:hypothetical protein Naga_100433g4 [Nannochloropsis gaditana]|uniref:Uncharacterized protein n=1 Tax=Nannochloropsis gaditana TaxID=72520 RepID=W7TJZ6_9STRA|nr:hypothetical protein Naga_100433g4 [Nannochloropsis gaditana]
MQDRRGSRRWSACCSDDDFIRVERWVNNQRALAPAAETLGCDRVPVEKERRRLPPVQRAVCVAVTWRCY